MELEHCVRATDKKLEIFQNRMKKFVNRGWLDNMEGITEGDEAAESLTQERQTTKTH